MKTAFRRLIGARVFSATAVGSLTLAVALVCSVTAILEAAYLTAPPFRNPDRLVDIWQTASPRSDRVQDYVQPQRAEEWASRGDFRSLEGFAAIGLGPEGVLVLTEGSARVEVRAVLGDWFGLTGVEMARGRGLTEHDDRADAEAAAVVSHELWQSRLGERLAPIRLGDRIYQVVGVTSAALPAGESVWVPRAHVPTALMPVAYAPLGRLRDGATVAQANEEIRHLAAAQVAADSARYAGLGATVLRHGSRSTPGLPSSSWLVLGALALVLLLGLSNLVHLFLLRVRRGATGLAVRGALGASLLQAGGHLAWEAVILAAAGCGFGLLLAVPGLDLARILLGSEVVLRATPRIGPVVVAGAVAASAVVAVTLALQAFRFGRKHTGTPLSRLGGRNLGSSRDRRRFAQGVLAAQVSASVVLIAAFVVLRTAHDRLSSLDVGYDAEGVVMADPDFEVAGIPPEGRWPVAAGVLESLERFPDPDATAWRLVGMSYPPKPAWDVVVDAGRANLPVADRLHSFYEVETRFFEALSVPVVDGRHFTDDEHAENAAVAIVTRGAASRWWPGERAVGRSLRISDGPWLTVVGVSEDMRRLDWLGRAGSIRKRPDPLVFVPAGTLSPFPTGWRTYDFWGDVKLAVRGSERPADAARVLERTIMRVAPGLPVKRLGTMRDLQVSGDIWPELSVNGALVAAGGGGALVLVLLGTFGLVAGNVQERLGEIGVRMALGADLRSVRRAVTHESLRAAVLGLALGAAGVGFLQHVLGPALFGHYGGLLTGGYSPGSVAAGAGAVLLVAFAACAAAVRPAATLQPARILSAD